jgi:dTDP-4-amino-4,6-dideoxygalactose transaminase
LVPLVDLAAAHAELDRPLRGAFERVVRASTFIQGAEVEAFEHEFAHYCGTARCVGVANGTDALTLLLIALGVGPGDEVVTSAFTFVGTVEAILRAGARPVLVDVGSDDQNLDPSLVAETLTGHTRAIVAVHLYGRVADMQALRVIAEPLRIIVIEDAAQAHGAHDGSGRRAGSLARASGFSFYPAKNLGALGDAGAVTTDDADLAAIIASLRDHGRSGKHRHDLVGYNARLDELQAAFLRVKLECLDEWNERRRAAATRYGELLAGVPGLVLPTLDVGEVLHVYGIRSERRDDLARALAEAGVATGVHYPVPIHRQPAFGELFANRSFPNAERWAATELSLPMHPHLTPGAQERIVDVVRATFGA